MNVTKLETIRLDEFPNLVWVHVHTDEGLVGLGETFFGAQAVEAYLHETVAPYLIGKDPLQIDRHARALYGYLGYRSSGVELRGNSAIDIALWDLFGKATNQPIYQLLGGLTREKIRIYNTCAGYRYVRSRPAQLVDNWGLPTAAAEGPYEDLDAFLHRADELALSLREQGITGMKIWPFDPYAEASGGMHISAHDLDTALEPFRKIRSAVGLDVEIMVEFHSLWNLPTSIKLARALEEFQPYWYEDPLKADNIDALAAYAASTDVPTTVSETLSTRWSFREVLEQGAARIIMLDLSWVGGIGEAKKIAAMAESYQLPVAPHDCTGPIVLMASMHLSLNAPNALIQETVRAYYTGWYTELVTDLPLIDAGYASLSNKPGLGTELLPGLTDRPDAHVRVSTAADV
ncbi:MAG TPA: mandelate racemase/muconate lactonizing enzyme family protein [Thermomicrobiales bacterium]|nr:mandelate racemase/muconate lactonizing enzyme family protein [Thermomicrobiales bacterium]